MTNKPLHSVAILVIVWVGMQGQLLAGQAILANGSAGPKRPLSILHSMDVPPKSPVAIRSTGLQSDAVALGLAKVKTYQFRTVDYPGASSSDSWDDNNGTAVGSFTFSTGTTPIAFYFHDNSYHLVNVPLSSESYFLGSNASGQMVGAFEDQATELHGLLYDGTSFIAIDPPGSRFTEAADISDSSVIVGEYNDGTATHGFVDNGGTFTIIDFPGATETLASGINSNGDIVGFYADSKGTHGFLLSGGVYHSLDFPLAIFTMAQGINDAGDIAGSFFDASDAWHGFTFARGEFNQIDVAGAVGIFIRRIKNNGNVVGSYSDGVGMLHGIIGR
jgi:uncharacterized membrane protein